MFWIGGEIGHLHRSSFQQNAAYNRVATWDE
jgi:hypothetical protein